MKHILILFIVFVFSSCLFAPGSYSNAEIFKINASEDLVIRSVNQFKINHPEFTNVLCFDDGRKDSSDLWYYVYFYYPDNHKIVFCYIRQSMNEKTDFALISITGKNGEWKDINKDFSNEENKREIEKFKVLILDRVKENLKDSL